MVEKNILLGDLFDDNLYLLCVISIFCDFRNWGLSQILNNSVKNLAITFNKIYISICIIKF